MKENKVMQEAKIKIVSFDTADVITTSGEGGGGGPMDGSTKLGGGEYGNMILGVGNLYGVAGIGELLQ